MMRRALIFLLWIPVAVMAEPMHVFVSVLPLQTFVEKVGGPHVVVQALVRPGYNPQTYDPTPQQISALAKADLYIRAGVPFEHAWMDRIRSANPDMPILDARAGIALREMDKHRHGPVQTHHDHWHEHDPHVWTSPLLVKQMIGTIRDTFSELDPSHSADYSSNHDAFVLELDRLDRDIRALLEPLGQRQFMVFHPAWGYFADTYGLVQVPIEHEGKEPGGRALARLIDQAKAEKIRVIFVQPQFDERQARQVARAIGGGVIAVDPLAQDYCNNLRQVAQQFAEVLRP
jgi:zinc transport system substrate-binding protein